MGSKSDPLYLIDPHGNLLTRAVLDREEAQIPSESPGVAASECVASRADDPRVWRKLVVGRVGFEPTTPIAVSVTSVSGCTCHEAASVFAHLTPTSSR